MVSKKNRLRQYFLISEFGLCFSGNVFTKGWSLPFNKFLSPQALKREGQKLVFLPKNHILDLTHSACNAEILQKIIPILVTTRPPPSTYTSYQLETRKLSLQSLEMLQLEGIVFVSQLAIKCFQGIKRKLKIPDCEEIVAIIPQSRSSKSFQGIVLTSRAIYFFDGTSKNSHQICDILYDRLTLSEASVVVESIKSGDAGILDLTRLPLKAETFLFILHCSRNQLS